MMPNPVQRNAARRSAREPINWSRIWLALCAVVLLAVVVSQVTGCGVREPIDVSPETYELVSCVGKFEELGPYKGVRIECNDGRTFLYWPNKYIYSRRVVAP